MLRALHFFVLGAAFAATATAAPGSVETLRRDVQRGLKLSTPSERASAIGRAFDGQDSAEAAQIAMELVFGRDEAQLVLDAAMVAVGRMHDPRVTGALRKGAEAGPTLRRLRAVEALGRSSAAGTSAALLPLLADADSAIRSAVTTALGRKVDDPIVPDVERMLGDSEWTVRSAAVATLARLGARRGIPALCATMRGAEGRLIDDCTAALAAVSGQRFGPDPMRYESWWAKEQKQDAPTQVEWKPPPCSFESPFLGTRSRRLLFILSTSDTMKDTVDGAAADAKVVAAIREIGGDLADDLVAAKTKLDVARVHLRAMLRTLKDGVRFDVEVYSGSPSFAFGDLVPAGAASRKRAEGRIANLSPGGYGNLHGALVRAFDPHGKDPYASQDGPDTIILFSDGALAEPGSKDPTEVGASAQRWNAVRQIRFITVAVGQSDGAMLARLAAGPPEGVSTSLP